MTRPSRPLIFLLAALAGLLAAGYSVASADGATDHPVTFITRLEPGNNLVGWTMQAEPVEKLFEELPQIDVVWTWDVEWRRWRLASPNMPERMWTLRSLSPGMGLVLGISGGEPIEWERPRRPAQGLVELRNGHNLVAWMGRDGAPLDLVARGIGRTLQNIILWSNESDDLVSYSPTAIQNQAEHPQVAFGQAIWVKVGRTVNWLQPTGLIPKIEWAPNTSYQQKQTAIGNLKDVIRHFTETYGIEADASALIIRIHDDPGHAGGEVICRGDTRLADGPPILLIATAHFAPPTETNTTLFHEYVHVVQCQLRGGYDHPSLPVWLPPGELGSPLWLLEGTAVREAALYLDRKAPGSRDGANQWNDRDAITYAPSLNQMEDEGYNGYHYPLGHIAANQLANIAGQEAWVEFYRFLAVSRLGPTNMWVSVPSWEDAFHLAFGLESDAFYDSFASLRESYGTLTGGWTNVTGRIKGLTSSPRTPMELLVLLSGGTKRFATRIALETDGSFQFRAPTRLTRELVFAESFARDWHHCAWIFDGQHFTSSDSSPPWRVPLSPGDLSSMTLPFIASAEEIGCVQLSGVVVDSKGRPLPGIRLRAVDLTESSKETGTWPAPTSTRDDGTFSVSVQRGRSYVVALDLAGSHPLTLTDVDTGDVHPRGSSYYAVCTVYHGEQGLASKASSAHRLYPSKDDVSDIVVRIEDGACSSRIQGTIRAGNRGLVDQASLTIYAYRHFDDGEDVLSSRALVGVNGAFDIAVPTVGGYVLFADVDGCGLWFGANGVTVDRNDAALIVPSDDGLTELRFQIPASLCNIELSGRLVDSDGVGVARRLLRIVVGDTHHAIHTDEGGGWSIVVSGDASYLMYVYFDDTGCALWYQNDGASASAFEATRIQVGMEDVTAILFRLPESPSTLCD